MSPSQEGCRGCSLQELMATPQASVTSGGVGITMSATQATVSDSVVRHSEVRHVNGNGMSPVVSVAIAVGISPGVYHVTFA